MELKKPKSKKQTPSKKNFPLPLKNEREMIGVFNGQSVIVHDWNSMNCLYYSGFFGKGTLSKGAPIHHIQKDDIPRIIFERQFKNLSKWKSNCHYNSPEKYSGHVKNNVELSAKSIEKLFQSSFDDNNDSWRSWKEKHHKDLGWSSESRRNRNELSFLEFKSGENYVDEEFKALVEGILESKELKKSVLCGSEGEETVIVLNDMSEEEASLESVNARLERLSYLAEENLSLNLEESFFLSSVLGCLKIVDINFSELSVSELWEKFKSVEQNFVEKYVTYHYYRSKGWVVRSGLKFGGNFLLYKDGPDYYHASYLVKVLDRRKKFCWREVIAMNRLVETFNKDLILSIVVPGKTTESCEAFPEGVKDYRVQEVLIRRWFPSKERFLKESAS